MQAGVKCAAENQRLCSVALILMTSININEVRLSRRLRRQAGRVYVENEWCVLSWLVWFNFIVINVLL